MGVLRNKIYDLLQKKLEMDIENVVIEISWQTVKKNKTRLRPIVIQFLFYKDKMNILTVKNLKTQKFPSLRTFLERQLPSTKKNDKKFSLIEKKVWYHILIIVLLSVNKVYDSFYSSSFFLIRYIVLLSLII